VRALRVGADSANSRDYVNIRSSTGAAIVQALGSSTNVDLDFRSRGPAGKMIFRTYDNSAKSVVTFVIGNLGATEDVDLDIQPQNNGQLKVRGNPVLTQVSAPTRGSSPGRAGHVAVDDDYLYFCVSDGLWVKAKIEAW